MGGTKLIKKGSLNIVHLKKSFVAKVCKKNAAMIFIAASKAFLYLRSELQRLGQILLNQFCIISFELIPIWWLRTF